MDIKMEMIDRLMEADSSNPKSQSGRHRPGKEILGRSARTTLVLVLAVLVLFK